MKLIKLLKYDIVLSISALLAILSSFIVKPDREYLSYINLPVLVLLFCLMIAVAGLKKAGAFDALKSALSAKISTEKSMIFALCIICFFTSAFITNDVALITFVPFSIVILKSQKSSSVIFCIVMETISANLGSLLTPIGNPQNLFLYTNYNMSLWNFFKITLPLGVACFAMILVCLFFRKNTPLLKDNEKAVSYLNKKMFFSFLILFVLCILSVLKIISCYITLAIVLLYVIFTDRKLLKNADYVLLSTFVFFFIFAGNIARIPAVYDLISSAMANREILMSAFISQIISNVPAATMLVSFTDNARSLILGTNIGGLGTVIASMASLISYRFIAQEKTISNKNFLLTFSVFNFAMLAVLLLIFV